MENQSPKRWIINPLCIHVHKKPEKIKINIQNKIDVECVFNENTKNENYNIKKDVDDIMLSIK
jgi:hypothetical protein